MTGWDTMVNRKAMIPFETPKVNEKKTWYARLLVSLHKRDAPGGLRRHSGFPPAGENDGLGDNSESEGNDFF